MIIYTWTILDLFADGNRLSAVRYLLLGNDGTNQVASEGKHIFSDKVPLKPLDQIVESDILQWLENDTTQDDVNPIKLTIENQLKTIKTIEKIDFPWLAGTFTIG